MNADAFRYFYGYHFAENRKIWDWFVTRLTPEQFIQPVRYSHGSVRDQLVHLMDADEVWFSELRGIQPSEPLAPANGDDRQMIRHHWDQVEQGMREYLGELRDDMLFTKPIKEPEEDKNLMVWQVLLHIANHGTDHRAQILRSLNDMGLETPPQDLIFYVYEHL
jgi:uncharacterized damage-inducible protein DinB